MTSRLQRMIKKNSIFPPLLDLNTCFRSSCCFGRPQSAYDDVEDANETEVRDDIRVVTEQSSGYGSFDTDSKPLPSWSELNTTADQKQIEVRNFDDVPSTPEPDDTIPSSIEIASNSIVATSDSLSQSEQTITPADKPEVEVDYPLISADVDSEVLVCASEKEEDPVAGVTSDDETSPQISSALAETSPKNMDVEVEVHKNDSQSPGSVSPTAKVKTSKKFRLLKKTKKDKSSKESKELKEVVDEAIAERAEGTTELSHGDSPAPEKTLAQASADSFRNMASEKEEEGVIETTASHEEHPAAVVPVLPTNSLQSSSVEVSDLEGKNIIEDAIALRTSSPGLHGESENGGNQFVEVDGEPKKAKKKSKFKLKFAKKKKKKDLDGRTVQSLPGSTVSKSESNASDYSKYSAGAILAALDNLSDDDIAKE